MSDKMSVFSKTVMNQKYAHDLDEGRKETWPEIGRRVAVNVLGAIPSFAVVDGAHEVLVAETEKLISDRVLMPAGRYLYASGRSLHQVQNCLLLRADDSREGWADLMQKATMALMTGAGIGVVYSDVRPEGSVIHRTGGLATGPIALMQMLNEAGRFIMQGGSRRSAIWAGLHWNHPDALKFVQIKNWSPEVRSLKEKDYNFPAPLDGTNISIILDDDFFAAYGDEKHAQHSLAHTIYWAVIRQMRKTAEPGFSIDVGVNAGENLRNACTEVTSRDDSDICNLASINMARINTLEEMERAVIVGRPPSSSPALSTATSPTRKWARFAPRTAASAWA
jgi:ribonucleoside-diphosphate reductase alpha chain